MPLSEIELNSGQIEGLPANPRQWTLSDVERLAASLEETPELLEMRCPIVVSYEGKYVTLGGNLRIAAARHNKVESLPCFVLEGATIQKMKEIVIKDNGSFGKWDWDSLANEWEGEELVEWGVDVWQPAKDAMPAELKGVDLTPDELPKIEGEGETAMERVIVVFPPDKRDEVAAMLGLASIDKVVYTLDELG